MTFYVLGNGFDLHYGIPTKYCHFKSYTAVLPANLLRILRFINDYCIGLFLCLTRGKFRVGVADCMPILTILLQNIVRVFRDFHAFRYQSTI